MSATPQSAPERAFVPLQPSAYMSWPTRVLSTAFGLDEPIGRVAYAIIVATIVLFRVVVVGWGTVDWTGPIESALPLPLLGWGGGVGTTGGWSSMALAVSPCGLFAWILVLASARRARSAGWPSWLGMLALVPFAQYVALPVLMFARPGARSRTARPSSAYAALHALGVVLLLFYQPLAWGVWSVAVMLVLLSAVPCIFLFAAVFHGTLASSERLHPPEGPGRASWHRLAYLLVLVALPFVMGGAGVDAFTAAVCGVMALFLFVVRRPGRPW